MIVTNPGPGLAFPFRGIIRVGQVAPIRVEQHIIIRDAVAVVVEQVADFRSWSLVPLAGAVDRLAGS